MRTTPFLLIAATAVALSACGLLHRRPAAPRPLDLNTASLRKIQQLPGITPSMAHRIVNERPYDEPDDLVERGILTRGELRRLEDRVTVEGPQR